MKKAIFLLVIVTISIIIVSKVFAQQAKERLNFGIIDTDLAATPTEILEACKPFERYISKRLNVDGNAIIVHSVPEMIKLLKDGTIQFAYVSNLDYIRIKNELNILPFAMVVKAGSNTYKATFIVRQDSGLKELKDLKGKKFAYTTKHSAHGYIFPNLLIKERFNQPLESFFSSTSITKKDSDGILSVLYKSTDVASVSNQTFDIMCQLRPRIRREIISLQESKPFVQGPVFFYDNNIKDKTLIERLKKEILQMDKIPEGNQILLLFKVGGFIPAKDSDYNSLRTIFNSIF